MTTDEQPNQLHASSQPVTPERVEELVADLADGLGLPEDVVASHVARALTEPIKPLGSLEAPDADPLLVGCPDCAVPAGQPCATSVGFDNAPHAGRRDAARLRSVEQGTCALCGGWMVRGVQHEGGEVDAWHPVEADAARCPAMADPVTAWSTYAEQLNAGLSPGHPGVEHFLPPQGPEAARSAPVAPDNPYNAMRPTHSDPMRP